MEETTQNVVPLVNVVSESQSPNTPMQTPSNTLKKGNPLKKILFIGCFLFVICILVIGGFLFVRSGLWNIVFNGGKYTADSALEEGSLLTKDLASSLRNSLDFSKFDKNNPFNVLDQSKATEVIGDLNKVNKLRIEQVDLAGKTLHTATTIELDIKSTNAYVTDTSVSLNLDIFTQYSENYQTEKWQTQDSKEFAKVMKNLTSQEFKDMIPELKIAGDFSLETSYGDIAGALEFYFVDESIFMKIFDLEVPVEIKSQPEYKNLLTIADTMIKVDISEQYDIFIDAVVAQVRNIDWDAQTVNTTDTLENAFKDWLKQMSKKDEALIKRVGNPIFNVISEAISKVELFTNFEKVEPIRTTTNITCTRGNLNMDSIVQQSFSAYSSIVEILMNDPEFKSNRDFSDVKEQIDFAKDEANDNIDKSEINIGLTSCSNNDNSYLSGYGLDLSLRFGATDLNKLDSEAEFSIDILDLSNNSTAKVEAPEYDVDYTEEIMQSLPGTVITPDPYSIYQYQY